MLENYKQPLLDNIIKFCSIPSVATSGEEYPLGNANYKCAVEIVELMKSLGFKTYLDPQGYYAYAEIGSGDMFGILGHMDVVPAEESEGWITPPFEPKIIDGVLYGRGVQDDKGPTIASIFALKALMDEGHEFKYKMRFIFGFNEETDWECINKYKANEEAPTIGFTPDSTFPVVYAEKGLLQVQFKTSKKPNVYFKGGNSFNSVPSSATINFDEKLEEELKKSGFDYSVEGGEIVVKGASAHAKNPWKGDSAIYKLAKALKNIGIEDDTVNFINNHLCDKDRFEGFTDEDLSDFSGPISINLGQVFADENGVTYNLDVRHPVTLETDEVVEIMKKVAKENNLQFEEKERIKAIYLPLDSELISTMISVYQEVTGDTKTEPIISGGATYARAFDNCVAFGPNYPHIPSSEHMPNEHVNVEQLMKTFEIYYEFLKRVCVK